MPAAPALLTFLRAELAPTPGRTRAALRVLVASMIGTAVVMSTHLPHGHWIVFTIFTVSPEDAGASVIRGVQRLIGTVVGGGVGMLLVIAFANEPPFLFVAIGAAVAFGVFLSRTMTAPYAGLLGIITLVLVAASHLDSPAAEVETALWRLFMVLIGGILGTGAQILLWPSDPEQRLLDDVSRRLGRAEELIRRALAAPGSPDPGGDPVVALSGLTPELDLLDNAEARYPSLRRRHTEQMALIGEVERLLTSALWLDQLLSRPGGASRLDEAGRDRLRAMVAACGAIRRDLVARRPAARRAASPDPGPSPAPSAGLPNLLTYMEATVRRIGAATAYLEPPGAGQPVPAAHSPLDTPARAPILTSAFSTANTADIKFALKCGLAVEICLALIVALEWPGLLTSVITCPMVAQSTLGASAYKALLRLAGAAVGGALGLAMITAVMPNVETLGGILLPLGACFGIAAWVTAGSSRISYAGLQIGMALSICTVDVFAATTNLVPARDRVLGIMLGIAVMGLVYELIWPLRAGRAMRPALASALRTMAVLADIPPTPRTYPAAIERAARHRLAVYRALASVLRLREDALMEPGAHAPAARLERDRVLELAGEAQAVFLALLALARHRLARPRAPLPADLADRLAGFDGDVRRALEDVAAALADPRRAPRPDLSRRAADLGERTRALASSSWATGQDQDLASFVEGELAIRREVVRELARLADALDEERGALTAP